MDKKFVCSRLEDIKCEDCLLFEKGENICQAEPPGEWEDKFVNVEPSWKCGKGVWIVDAQYPEVKTFIEAVDFLTGDEDVIDRSQADILRLEADMDKNFMSTGIAINRIDSELLLLKERVNKMGSRF